MNRFFTRTELAEAYHHPKHVLEQLLAEVAPVEKNDGGEPLYLEAHVDAWLTARYTVTPWRSPPSEAAPRMSQPAAKKSEEPEDFVTVAEAQRRFLDGKMSRKWWYRMAQTGQIAHHRVGETILFRTEDIEKFIAESRRTEVAETVGAEPASAPPIPSSPRSAARKKPNEPVGGYKFFPRR